MINPIQFHAWANNPSILAPPNFYANDKMLEMQKSDTLLYSSKLEEWEINTRLPLTQQFYWEWQQLWKKYDGHEFSITYFDSKNCNISRVGMQPRQADISQSAYLRVLALAYSQWNAPIQLMKELANNSLLVDFQLAKIEPQSPPSLWKKIPIETVIENLNEKWLEKVSQILLNDPNQLPFAGMGNLLKNDRLVIDLEFYAIAMYSSSKNSIPTSELFHEITGISSDSSNTLIMLATRHSKFLQWQTHLCFNKIYLPNLSLLENDNISFEYNEQGIKIHDQNKIYGNWLYWHHQLEPVTMLHTNGSICSLLMINRSSLSLKNIPKNYTLKMITKLNIHHRENNYGNFEQKKIYNITDICL